MQMPEQTQTSATISASAQEIFRPLRHDPSTGDPLIYPGLSAAIEARLVPMMRKHGVGQRNALDDLLVMFDEDGDTPRNRVRTLLLMAAGILARRHRRITKADWDAILETPDEEPRSAVGWKVERYKLLIARLVVRGIIERGEVRRETV